MELVNEDVNTNLSSYNTSNFFYGPQSWIQMAAMHSGRYFFLSAFCFGLFSNLVTLLLSHRPPLGNIKLGAVAILRSTAYIDIANLVSSAFFTWVLNYTDLMAYIKSIILFNFLCKFYNMLTHLTIMLNEWILVVFALERVAITYKSSQGLRYFSSLRVRIGFSLFTVVLFAASCNYMWMFGRGLDEGGNASCLMRPEFFIFYYGFLIYLEPVVDFLVPHCIVVVCSIFIVYLIICRGRRFSITLIQINSPQQNGRNDSPIPGKSVNQKMMQIFFIQAFFSIGIDLFRNVAKLYSIYSGSPIFSEYQSFLLQVHVTKFCLKDLFTAIVVFSCFARQTLRSSSRTRTSFQEMSHTLLNSNNRNSNTILSLEVITDS